MSQEKENKKELSSGQKKRIIIEIILITLTAILILSIVIYIIIDVHKGKPEVEKPDKGAYRPADVQDRLMLRMLNEAQACLREGVVSEADLLDVGIIFGTGFAPFRGGPMHYVNNQGVNSMLNTLQQLQQKHGDRFTPDTAWQDASW